MAEQRKIAILGAGESGLGAAVLAKKQGYDVFVSDLSVISPRVKAELDALDVQWEEQMHTEDEILSADEIVKSPGIPDKAPIVAKALGKKIPVISEIEFAGRFSNAFFICITGSNGKTTVTSLIYHLLKDAGLDVGLAGNIGYSLARQVADGDKRYYVLELSSFQLDNMYCFKADIAVLMNISPDHLDRYDYKFENYINSKFRILQNMDSDGLFIYSADDEVIGNYINQQVIIPQKAAFSVKKAGDGLAACEQGDELVVSFNEKFSMLIKDLHIKGMHNKSNSMAAMIAAKALNIKSGKIRNSMRAFKGVEHRLEKLPYSVRGVSFVNDSKATNVNSVWYALESMEEDVVWIVGGVDKGNDYSELFPLVEQKVKAIVCLGVDNEKLLHEFSGMVHEIYSTDSMQDAVNKAYSFAEKGSTVLLSPACASFDLFENYEDRGEKFKEAVSKL